MAKPAITGIAPFFIVRNVPASLAFYRDKLGFEITYQGPTEDDIFFGIVQRGAAMIILKDIGVDPVPNYTRDIKKRDCPLGCIYPCARSRVTGRRICFAQP